MEIEDYYTYYVSILGIDEDVFWNADVAFVRNITDNQSAYNAWYNYALSEARNG